MIFKSFRPVSHFPFTKYVVHIAHRGDEHCGIQLFAVCTIRDACGGIYMGIIVSITCRHGHCCILRNAGQVVGYKPPCRALLQYSAFPIAWPWIHGRGQGAPVDISGSFCMQSSEFSRPGSPVKRNGEDCCVCPWIAILTGGTMPSHPFFSNLRGYIFPKRTTIMVKASLKYYPILGNYSKLCIHCM